VIDVGDYGKVTNVTQIDHRTPLGNSVKLTRETHRQGHEIDRP
jgi:hypothetical protein